MSPVAPKKVLEKIFPIYQQDSSTKLSVVHTFKTKFKFTEKIMVTDEEKMVQEAVKKFMANTM
jgi:ABC-type phosphate/phosphonate transport system ATPase subunit